jgi:hypothetical protein
VDQSRRAVTRAAYRRISRCLREQYRTHMRLPLPGRIVAALAPQSDDGGWMRVRGPDDRGSDGGALKKEHS